MASTTKSTNLPTVPPHEAGDLIERAGQRLTQYDYKGKQGAEYVWERGFGLTNPQTVKARLTPMAGGNGVTVEYTVSILALMDPFGFTDESCDRFIAELQAHAAQDRDGTALPEVPKDKRGTYILLGSLGFAGLFVLCGGVIVMIAALS